MGSLGASGVLEPSLPTPPAPQPSCSYHTGSLAFGALILTLVQMARVILEYIDNKLRGEQLAPQGGAVRGQ